MSGATMDMAMTELQRVLGQVWAPIGTAPKSWVDADGLIHGVYLLGFIPAGPDDEPYGDPQVGITVVWWEPLMGPEGCWYDGTVVSDPTHWMPLPDAPVVAHNG